MKEPTIFADLESKTPAEIDAVLFELEGRKQSIENRIAEYRDSIRSEKTSPVWRERIAVDYERYLKDHADELEKLRGWIMPLVDEFRRRGGWTRYTFCLSYGGHYHRGASCHTTRGSALTWIADLSGLNDNEVIEKVGYHACSQDECFPTAPLHPAWAISEQRDKDAKNADREAKYAKGLATRQKKVANIQKRIAKAQQKIATAHALLTGEELRMTVSYAESDIKWETQSLQYAQRDLDRWVAKKEAS